MASTRDALKSVENNLSESIGLRTKTDVASLSPVPSVKDQGRQPLRTYGKVDLNMVTPDPAQPRKEFTQESLEQLAKSIAKKQLQPITVRWSAEIKRWLIVSGERRYRASKLAGLKTIDCHFEQRDLSDSELLEQQLVENLLRENLKPIEQAKAFKTLMDSNGWTGIQLAKSLSVSQAAVSRALSLLDLPDDIQLKVNDGELGTRAAYELSKLPTENAQRAALDSGNVSAKKIKAAVNQRKGKAKSKRGFKQTFASEHGVKVTVSSGSKTTYEEIELALSEALSEVQHYIKNGRVAL